MRATCARARSLTSLTTSPSRFTCSCRDLTTAAMSVVKCESLGVFSSTKRRTVPRIGVTASTIGMSLSWVALVTRYTAKMTTVCTRNATTATKTPIAITQRKTSSDIEPALASHLAFRGCRLSNRFAVRLLTRFDGFRKRVLLARNDFFAALNDVASIVAQLRAASFQIFRAFVCFLFQQLARFLARLRGKQQSETDAHAYA